MYPQPMMAPQRGGGGGGSLVIQVLLSIAFLCTLGFCFWNQAQINDLREDNAKLRAENEETREAAQQVLTSSTELQERTQEAIDNYDRVRERLDTLAIQVRATGQQILNGSDNLTNLADELAGLRDQLTNEVIRQWLSTRGEGGELERVLREAVGSDTDAPSGNGGAEATDGDAEADESPDTTARRMEGVADDARRQIDRTQAGGGGGN